LYRPKHLANRQRVDVADLVGLPGSFTLLIDVDHFMRHCHPVWSHGRHVGVAFD
jgi:hypothetical protein